VGDNLAAEIATALIAASGALLVAGAGAAASYLFTKKREREAELRKEKLEHYKDLVASMSGIIAAETTDDGQRDFSRACNKLNLVASQPVLAALREFRLAIHVGSSPLTQDRHDDLLSQLFREIRKYLAISPRDDDSFLRVGLWAAGVPPQKTGKQEQRVRPK
jgi:hypothetical protein